MSSELLAIIESQQETIATLTKLLELELAKVKYRLPDPPNWDLFKYGEILKPSCSMQDSPPPPKPPECRLIKNGKWINKGEYK